MADLRIMILNYSTKDHTCAVTFTGSIKFLRCSHDPNSAEDPDEVITTTSSSPYQLAVPAGEICGFLATAAVTVANPDPRHLMLLSAGGKDPWPPPPPPPPGFANDYKFHERYLAFAHGGGADPDPIPIEVTFKAGKVEKAARKES